MATAYIGYGLDLRDIHRVLDEVDGELHLTRGELAEIGMRAAHLIKTRTARGRDFEGKPFQRYSESYADYRDEKGRNVTPVDLMFEGHMLAALQGFSDGEHAIVEVMGAAEKRKAVWHNEGTRRMPQRRFLDIADEGADAEALAEVAARFIAARIEGL